MYMYILVHVFCLSALGLQLRYSYMCVLKLHFPQMTIATCSSPEGKNEKYNTVMEVKDSSHKDGFPATFIYATTHMYRDAGFFTTCTHGFPNHLLCYTYMNF